MTATPASPARSFAAAIALALALAAGGAAMSVSEHYSHAKKSEIGPEVAGGTPSGRGGTDRRSEIGPE